MHELHDVCAMCRALTCTTVCMCSHSPKNSNDYKSFYEIRFKLALIYFFYVLLIIVHFSSFRFITSNMTYHFLPSNEHSYKKVEKPTHINKKELIWTSGCEFINRSKSEEEKSRTNAKKNSQNCCILANTIDPVGVIPLTPPLTPPDNNNDKDTGDEQEMDEVDGHKCSDSDIASPDKETKTIGEEEDEMLRNKFKNRGRRNAICETQVEERTGFPRVLKHYIHLKTFQKCGLG